MDTIPGAQRLRPGEIPTLPLRRSFPCTPSGFLARLDLDYPPWLVTIFGNERISSVAVRRVNESVAAIPLPMLS